MFAGEIIAAVQLEDLRQADEKRKSERAAEQALAIRRKTSDHQYNASQLLEQLTGGSGEAAPTPQATPTAKPVERTSNARFPPPPTK